jgi:hypothetical protein
MYDLNLFQCGLYDLNPYFVLGVGYTIGISTNQVAWDATGSNISKYHR